MKKLLLALLFVCSNAWATDFQDIWWDSTKSGMGIIIGQQGSNLFVSWFTYSAGGGPVWYVFTAPLVVTSANSLEGLSQQSAGGTIQTAPAAASKSFSSGVGPLLSVPDRPAPFNRNNASPSP